MLKARFGLFAAVGLGVLSPMAVYADEAEDVAEARRLYNEARTAFAEERFRDAALNFEAASRLKPHAVALYTAAQAWEAASEPARAADAYSLALSTPKLSESQATRARERLKELQSGLGTVVVVSSGEARVQMDDHNEVPVPARLHGQGGEHVLLILRADGSVERRKVILKVGETLEIDADPQPEGAEEPTEPGGVTTMAEPRKRPVKVEADTASAPPNLWKTVGFVTAGAGVAALGGAALLGISAKDAEDTYKSSPTRDTLDHARGIESKTNLMLVIGGVLTAGGVGLIVWQSMEGGEPAKAARVGVHPGGVWAEGRF